MLWLVGRPYLEHADSLCLEVCSRLCLKVLLSLHDLWSGCSLFFLLRIACSPCFCGIFAFPVWAVENLSICSQAPTEFLVAQSTLHSSGDYDRLGGDGSAYRFTSACCAACAIPSGRVEVYLADPRGQRRQCPKRTRSQGGKAAELLPGGQLFLLHKRKVNLPYRGPLVFRLLI